MSEQEVDFGHDYVSDFEASSDEEYIHGSIRGKHDVYIDEPTWIPHGAGNDDHPSPVDYMVTALTACQLSVLSQALEKARVEEFSVSASATADQVVKAEIPEGMPGNTANRVKHIDIELELTVPEEYESRAQRCLDIYDQGCIVGQSYRAGVQYDPHVTLTVDE
jgi:uncharacterized OsmC-like protein